MNESFKENSLKLSDYFKVLRNSENTENPHEFCIYAQNPHIRVYENSGG